MPETPCLKVPKTRGEKAIKLARKLSLLNREFKIQRLENHLYIPLARKPLRSA
ncbi:MAG: hypothetical protein ACE5KC_01935 [Candidatus Bathyarchaeia archaeon]